MAPAAVFDEQANHDLFRESARPLTAVPGDWRQLTAQGSHAVVSPDDCVALSSRLDRDCFVCLHPLLGGMSPELGWSSPELFASSVMPRLQPGRNRSWPLPEKPAQL